MRWFGSAPPPSSSGVETTLTCGRCRKSIAGRLEAPGSKGSSRTVELARSCACGQVICRTCMAAHLPWSSSSGFDPAPCPACGKPLSRAHVLFPLAAPALEQSPSQESPVAPLTVKGSDKQPDPIPRTSAGDVQPASEPKLASKSVSTAGPPVAVRDEFVPQPSDEKPVATAEPAAEPAAACPMPVTEAAAVEQPAPQVRAPEAPGPGRRSTRRAFAAALLALLFLGFGLGIATRYWLVPRGASLEIRSDPPGASVLLNGRLLGATPLHLDGLESGEYELRLEKESRVPLIKVLRLENEELVLNELLPEVPFGKLTVAIDPPGSEVLLDGEWAGHTPLHLSHVAVGAHELLVRRTNYEPHQQRFTVDAGQTAEFGGFALRDLILAMLRRQIQTEPQRVSHYVDLGRYLFVQEDLESSAEIYSQGIRIAAQPLVFTPEMSAQDRELEQRLREDDIKRLNDDLNKKRRLGRKDLAAFRERIDQAQEKTADEQVGSWVWVSATAESMIREKKMDRAERLYLRHIEAAPQASSVSQARIALVSLRLRMHNLPGVREVVQTLLKEYARRPDLLRQAAHAVYTSYTGYRDEEQKEVLSLAENLVAAGQAVAGPGEMKALCSFELGNVYVLQGRLEEALKYFQESVVGTGDEPTKELRSMKQAECLGQLQRYPEAREIYQRMLQSPREQIVRMARLSLDALAAKDQKP